jgi:hypothetical protein
MNDSIVELAWLFCKRAKEKGLDEDEMRWVVERVLERFDSYDYLLRVSLENIKVSEKEGKNELGQRDGD